MIPFATAVLAGGRGVRIGGGKPMRSLAGSTLVDHAVRRARSWDAPNVLVLRTLDQTPSTAMAVVLDDPSIPGPLGGLAAALAWGREMGAGAVLTLPCDMPFLPQDLPHRLGAALAPGVSVAMAASGGRRHPVCALWRPSVLDTLRRRAAQGRLSLNGLAEDAGAATVVWSEAEPDPFFNINAQDDLARAEAWMAAAEAGRGQSRAATASAVALADPGF